MDTYILRESERERGEREKMKEIERQTDRQTDIWIRIY